MIDRAFRGAEGGVQHGAIFGDVDLVAAEHGVDAAAQAALFGQAQQEAERFVGDAVFGVIEVEAEGLDGQAFAALGVVGEELPHGSVFDLGIVGFQRLPGGALYATAL